MRRYYVAAGALLLLFIVACSIERADALPLFNHSAAAGVSNAHCLSGDAWAVTLTITATNPELSPVADITYTGNEVKGVPVPHVMQFTTQAPTWTANVHITWSDGFTQDKGPFVATRPDGCTPPPTSGTTTTTTCAQVIPPRSDCEVTTSTVPTTSSVPVVVTPSVPQPSTTAVAVATSTPAAGPATSVTRVSPTTVVHVFLPTTGTGSTIVWVAVAILAVGTVAILITVRRRRP